MPNHAMHADLLQRAASMKCSLVAASQTGDGSRWVAVRYFKCFFRGFRKTAVLKTKADGSATETKSCCARPLHCVSLNRASPMPSLTWLVVVFAPPNNGMHRTLAARFIGLKADSLVLSSPVMPAVGLHSEFPIVFCVASGKPPF